jgi:hypothetical protein
MTALRTTTAKIAIATLRLSGSPWTRYATRVIAPATSSRMAKKSPNWARKCRSGERRRNSGSRLGP